MVRVVVDIGELRGVQMHFQAPFYAFETADGGLHLLRLNAVAEGDGRGGDAVLRIHPAGRSHADVSEDAAGVVQVIVEMAPRIGLGADGIKIGFGVRIMVGTDLRFRVALVYRGAFFDDEGAAHLGGEGAEGLHHMGVVSVNVQMVRLHRGNDGYLRVELEEGTVKFIGLHHHRGVFGHEQVGAVVPGNASEEGAAALAAFREDVCRQGGGGGFAVGAGYGQAALSPGNLSQGAGALEHPVASVHDFPQLAQVGRDGGGINHQRFLHVGGNQLRTVFIVDRDALGLQAGRELGGGAVVTGHLITLELEVTGNGAHADASDSYEIYVFHTNL